MEINEEIFTTTLKGTFEETSAEFQLAATVAEFAEILRESFWAREGSLEAVLQSIEDIEPQIHNERVDELRSLVQRATHSKTPDSESL